MVKNAVPKVFRVIVGADGRRRSNDPYGVVGRGISQDELPSKEYHELLQTLESEATKNQWTAHETQQVLITRWQNRKEPEPINFELLLQSELVLEKESVAEGAIITAQAIPWLAVYKGIKGDPGFLAHFAKYPREFEEFIAGAYDQAGWDEVILTPRSGDRGRDVIAVKRGIGSIRFLEQTKAYSPGHLVDHDDVRAMLGVLQTDSNSSKALITTTSDFQPYIRTGPEFAQFMPYRLELRNGIELLQWLSSIAAME